MSELSYLEKLLDGAEVEWVALNKLATFLKGKSLPKEKITPDGNRYCIHYGELFTHYGPIIDKVCSKTNQAINESILSEKNDVLMPTSDVTPRGLATASCIQESGVILGGDILIIRCSGVDGRYLSNFIINNKKKILQMVKGSTVYHLYAKDIGKLLIPIPCPNNPEKSLAIQSEIVRILDKFTELTAELTAELNMRKKQYNYYRDQLLNLEGRENTREMRIGDIYDFQYGTGNTIPKSGGQYPVYGSNGIVGSHDKYNSEDSPVIGHIGAYAGIVNWGQGKHFVTYNGVICRHKSKEVLQKYAYYLLLLQDFGSKSNSASQPFVSYNILNAPIVLVPPLQEQARIVAILDKFDTLTNSITEGLPREIELRQKQYEYYRDLLFNFPKPETVSN
ncbi:restriction endonuclease subunit S [Escherichia coli]|uniref:restriction endonuclease subunit S n=1 Tax=Escherichia coli TaxID=562 RepID=UPI0010200233|nr:restriction endonuclease subunit S [Escherichia coli]